MKKLYITFLAASLLILSLSACAAQEQPVKEKPVPKDVTSGYPVPYTGEVGQSEAPAEAPAETPADPEDPGFHVYSINDDGTSQEINVGNQPAEETSEDVPSE